MIQPTQEQVDRMAWKLSEAESSDELRGSARYVLGLLFHVTVALSGLLQDTQHLNHANCRKGPCPVKEARVALAALKEAGIE